MPAFEPQTRFLLRGSALLIGLLTLWWLVLLSPMLYLLKGAAGVFVHIAETASGDWSVRVPLEKVLPAGPQRPRAQQIQSVDFDLARRDAVTFTFSLPVYWAIMLAAPRVRRNLRPLLLGTALMSALEVMLVLGFAEIAARGSFSQFVRGENADARQMRALGEYLVVNVLPYILPFMVALCFHRELRNDILPFSKGLRSPVPSPFPPAPKR